MLAASWFRHVFLQRRNALDRLLSLHYAKVSGMWGSHIDLVGGTSPAPIAANTTAGSMPVEELALHEVTCRRVMQQLWQLFQSFDVQSHAIYFEDIYLAERSESEKQLTVLLEYLGLTPGPAEDAAWTRELFTNGEQGTRQRYQQLAGMHELQKRLTTLTATTFDCGHEAVEWRALGRAHPGVVEFFIDVLPARVANGEDFEVGGVVVLNQHAPQGLQLRLVGDGRAVPLRWGQPSERMARKHPDAGNAAHARWSGQAQFNDGETSLSAELIASNGDTIVLGEILRSVEEDYNEIRVEPDDRLIIDIGANDGGDTWHYLRKGFRVVAVEAIPELCGFLRSRLAAQVLAGRLVIEQSIVTRDLGTSSLTINMEWTEWSSAHEAGKASAGKHRVITAPGITLASLMLQNDVPYYIKIDIEGGELDAVRSLAQLPASRLPTYLSVETNGQIFDVVQALWNLGYHEFQLVRQGEKFLPPPPKPSREGLDYRRKLTGGMSGPFGRDLPGEAWTGLVEIIRCLLVTQGEMQDRQKRGEHPGWYDIHTRRC